MYQSIGRQRFRAGDVTCTAGPGWPELADARPVVRVDMEFLSPTTFRQGPGHLPLPVPYNVFYWPWRVWQAYAPPADLPDDWLDWCRDEVFVTDHRLETAPVRIAGQSELKGFVGWARFETHKGTREQLRLLHALAQLAVYTGVGYKTTMGLGAVAVHKPASAG
ncbi:MAG: CRISPR system precrRNA processing endoribonuclease RAMP protein Cas6 [Chloroflexota bacterium]